jgi:hypothetical protein
VCSLLGGSLLGGLLRFLGFLLGLVSLLLDGVDFLDHESAGDALTNFDVGEDATVGTGHSAGRVAEAAEGSGALHSEALLSVTVGLLCDVLNSELATGGLNSAELVRLGAVRRSSFVCDSPIQHFQICIY